jgi:hypothetical protein
MRHVLQWRLGRNSRTKQDQWQAWKKDGERKVLYVPHHNSALPKEGEVWLCDEAFECLYENPWFRVESVFLIQGICPDKELRLRFERDPNRLIGGKPAWGSYHWFGFVQQTLEAINFVPDRHGTHQPSEGHEFWLCRYRQVAHLSRRGHFGIIVVELLREDVEAREKFLAEKHAEEERKQQEEVQRRLESERRAKEFDEYLKTLRGSPREIHRDSFERPVRQATVWTGGGCRRR